MGESNSSSDHSSEHVGVARVSTKQASLDRRYWVVPMNGGRGGDDEAFSRPLVVGLAFLEPSRTRLVPWLSTTIHYRFRDKRRLTRVCEWFEVGRKWRLRVVMPFARRAFWLGVVMVLRSWMIDQYRPSQCAVEGPTMRRGDERDREHRGNGEGVRKYWDTGRQCGALASP